MMKRVSLGIVIAALLVSAPRLTLAFILGDGIRVPEQIELVILTVTGIGSGVVLTIGNAVLAHALAIKANQRSWLWWIEATAWVLFLAGAVVVMAPTLVAGLEKSSLATVLQSAQSKWLWAITAVLIVELLVGASMAASILANEEEVHAPHHPAPQRRSKPSLLTRFGEVLVTKLEQTVEPNLAPGQTVNAMMQTEQPLYSTPSIYLHEPNNNTVNGISKERVPRLSKRTAIDQLLELYRQNPQVSLQVVSERIGRTPQTVATYLDELQGQGIVTINDSGVYLQS